MNRTSFALPDRVAECLPDNTKLADIQRVPATIQKTSPHLVFDPSRLPTTTDLPYGDGRHVERCARGSPHMTTMPAPGSLCWIVIDKPKQRYLGRVKRVDEYQQTRVILLVEHIRSPATISIAVPYQYYEGKDESSTFWHWLISMIYWQPRQIPDHEQPARGTSFYSVITPLSYPISSFALCKCLPRRVLRRGTEGLRPSSLMYEANRSRMDSWQGYT